MAPKSKKTNNKPSRPKKKATAKKRTGKQAVKTSKTIFIVLGSFLIISLVAFGYFLGQNNAFKTVQTDKSHENYTTKQLLDDLSKIKTTKPREEKKTINKKVITVEKKIAQKPLLQERGKAQVIRDKKEPVKIKDISLAYRGKKPKLAVVIDDVHTAAQIRAIRALSMKVTPSIFPPYKLAPKSNLLARGLKHYMVHLPMESGNKQFNTQDKTLKTSFTKEQMETRIKEIKTLFPTAKYINNHTGSVFTDNYQAMHRLYQILRKYGFVFIDSRTIGSTKVRKIAHEFGDAYVARDIFIDNRHNIPYIHKQLAQAVKIAKKKGYAIAIGHPHKITMQALASAKQILKDVELVYIDDIYKKR